MRAAASAGRRQGSLSSVATATVLALSALAVTTPSALPTALAAPAASVAMPATATAGTGVAHEPATQATSRELIGRSVRGRPIRAWHLGGTPGDGPVVVLLAAMHGDETAPSRILTALRDGGPILGADVWVVPTLNPDGKARHRRWNARGVDLNRNYPASWRRTTGRYDSGRRAGSEPETRAVMSFLTRVRPDAVVSFHQPLNGVDRLTTSPALARRLAKALRLPRRTFDCHGGCHGNLTQWFNARLPGAAVTVELGRHPSSRYLTKVAPRALLRVFGAHR